MVYPLWPRYQNTNFIENELSSKDIDHKHGVDIIFGNFYLLTMKRF